MFVRRKKSNEELYYLAKKQYQQNMENAAGLTEDEAAQQETITPKQEEKLISKEVLENILHKIQQFEKSKTYLNPQMTLATMANAVEVNQKYLSYVLNNEIGKNFNQYINELRIEYAIHQLKTNKEFKNLPIKNLADKCGFSTHSKFSQAFKKYTGKTPKEFIEGL